MSYIGCVIFIHRSDYPPALIERNSPDRVDLGGAPVGKLDLPLFGCRIETISGNRSLDGCSVEARLIRNVRAPAYNFSIANPKREPLPLRV